MLLKTTLMVILYIIRLIFLPGYSVMQTLKKRYGNFKIKQFLILKVAFQHKHRNSGIEPITENISINF